MTCSVALGLSSLRSKYGLKLWVIKVRQRALRLTDPTTIAITIESGCCLALSSLPLTVLASTTATGHSWLRLFAGWIRDLHLRKVELSYHMNRTCCSFNSLWRAIWYLNIFREIKGRDDYEDSSIRGKDFGVNRNAHLSLTDSILENVLKNCGSSFTKAPYQPDTLFAAEEDCLSQED